MIGGVNTHMAEIPLASLLNLTSEEAHSGWVRVVRRNERDGDSSALYCCDAESFHERYFSVKNYSRTKGVSLCFLELETNLWLLTKGVRCEHGTVKEIYKEYAGRLQVCFHKRNHSGNIVLKQQIDRMTAHSILDRPYSFLRFAGYNQIRLKFGELKRIVELNLSDWRQALRAVFGVYLISDTRKGGAYVGSAYGKDGLWGRWGCYASGDFCGHGGDKGLIKRIGRDKDYPENFEFSILEVISKNTSEKEVRKREAWWKDTLRTRKNHANNEMNEN